MSFDDYVGLFIFLVIVVVSSLFRSLKEVKNKPTDKEEVPTTVSPTQEKKIPQGKESKSLPQRRVIIRMETEPSPSVQDTEVPKEASLSTDKEIEKPRTLAQELKKTLDELIQETIPSQTQNKEVPPIKATESPEDVEGPIKKIKKPVSTKKTYVPSSTALKKPLMKQSVKPLRSYGEIHPSAPMERISISSPKGSIVGKGKIGMFPSLQWAIIMSEILSPPLALRSEEPQR